MNRPRRRVIIACAAAVGTLLLAVLLVHAVRGNPRVVPDRPIHAATLKERFAILSRHHSNKCALRPQSLDSISVNGRLQGSCCSSMNLERYVRQIRGLKQYASVSEIPRDPYDIPVRLAKRLTSFASAIKLTSRQQAAYNRAAKLAGEHGPCCCHCWRWTAFEGQAKYLITQRGYDGRRIAAVWDLEDGCGGA